MEIDKEQLKSLIIDLITHDDEFKYYILRILEKEFGDLTLIREFLNKNVFK